MIKSKRFIAVFLSVMLFAVMFTDIPQHKLTVYAATLTIQELQNKFPDGSYWNHAGNPGSSNSVNNQDGYTYTPCSVHGVVNTKQQTCNGFQPGDIQLSWQCMGFAEKLGYDTTGYNPRVNDNGWKTYENSSALDNLKAGDIVRYKNNGHSIFVTGINGNTVTYADCNSDGHCIIRWNQTISKSTLKASFTHLRSAPKELIGNNPEGYLDSVIGGEGCVNVRGWAFDRDAISESVSIHVYIGGPAGSGHVYGIGKADKERKDVNEAFGITGNHGFDTTFDVSESPGEYDIYVYAINMGEGTNNPLIGHSKVTVKAKHTHTYVENVVPATCTVDGEKTFTCSVCGDFYKESIKAIGHQYIDTVKPPTYTEDGYTLHTCSVCNDSYKDNETLPSGHVMEESEAAGQTISNGDYWIYNEHDMNYFLDVPGVEFSHDGANVQMWYDSSNMPSEFDVWTVTYLENGFYKIRQRGTNLCLDVSDASINRGANVQLSDDNSSFAQQWSISKTQHGYTLQARCSSYNLDVMDGKIESGTNVRTWSANDQKAQSFCFIPYSPDERPIEDGVYNIQSVCSDNYYLDISGEPGEYQNNSNAQIWNGATDKFKIVYAGDGWYKIYEESTGLALEVNNGDDQKCFLHNERNIQLYENNESRGQFWKIRKTDDGHYFLISKLSGYYLDLLDGKCTDGQNVSQVYYIGGNPQKWNFIKVNTKGDLNDDGEFNISDLVLLQKWLLAVPDTELANWRAADLCEDGKLDAFDMIKMRKLLIQTSSLSAQ